MPRDSVTSLFPPPDPRGTPPHRRELQVFALLGEGRAVSGIAHRLDQTAAQVHAAAVRWLDGKPAQLSVNP